MNNCGYFLVRNIGCILKGDIDLMYTHLYSGNEFSDDCTRIYLYIKVAGLDYHTDSLPYIRNKLMTIALSCTMFKKNVYRPIAHLSSAIFTDLQSVSGFNTMLLNNMYVIQKVSSVYRLSIVQEYFSKLIPKVNLNVKDDSLDENKLIQYDKEEIEENYLKGWYPPCTSP